MFKTSISVVVLSAGFALAVLAAGPAEAKPKTNPGGCSMSQLQQAANGTAAGRACSQAQDQSVINGTTFIMFVCTSEGVYCCPENAGSAAECTKISSIKVAEGVLDRIAPGLTLQRN